MKANKLIALMDANDDLRKRCDEAWAVANAMPTQKTALLAGEEAKGLEAMWYSNIDAIVKLADSF